MDLAPHVDLDLGAGLIGPEFADWPQLARLCLTKRDWAYSP
jgi:hypothetical protein